MGQDVFLNIDPPYVQKGAQLYRNFFNEQDHKDLYSTIAACKHPWIVTYDACDFVKALYEGYTCREIIVNYSASEKRSAEEYMFFSKELVRPKELGLQNKKDNKKD